ncbi:hypothetical protein G5B88_00265 [Herbaspirillum seropedicae]|uniref:DUF6587 family protein n=1 Tax=Herbaspirillum seropedicae TaxID=964 RepID=UPI0002FBF112|nr:DUF6587 family protein [Herbaspirillum seropedicae]AKN63802.1 hypothetical protein ACP92_00260 [Herbaspirillum seropedicae]NQE30156.1 hypothetical protein [Herbaspirillum seropedicae]UMU19710.1 hypothetical protein G5B88_00265 [Herbaspirillum seropedicae]
MNHALWWQYAVIAALVTVSTLYMLRKLAPTVSWRWQARMASWLLRRRGGMWRALGRRWLPPAKGGGCGGGACDGCGDSGDALPPLEQKIQFHRRR